MRGTALIAGLLVLLGCGHTGTWDMSVPWSMDVDQLLAWSIGGSIPAAFTAAVQSFGGTVTADGPQRIHFRQALANNCEPGVAGYVGSFHLDTIEICPPSLTDPLLLRFVVFHEFGHSLGQLQHRPCESKGLMAPTTECSRDAKGFRAQEYQPGDRAWICQGGDVVHARCSP